MALEKLKITPYRKQGDKLAPAQDKVISVLFNPASYSISKSVRWGPVVSRDRTDNQTNMGLNAPPVIFKGGDCRQLTLDLFFDVTEPAGMIDQAADVRTVTDKIVALTQIDRDQGRPPVCEVFWGKANTKDFPFLGVITNLTQKFTLFKGDGTPLRANLTVAFTEFLAPEVDKRKTDPELTTHVVKRGDTLSSIAGEVYHDPTLWRIIAEANSNLLHDPRQLGPGLRLTIPKLS